MLTFPKFKTLEKLALMIQQIIHHLETVLNCEPWYGRSIYSLLEEAGKSDVYKKPGGVNHSMMELLYHMETWATYTLSVIKEEPLSQIKSIESLDWRTIEPKDHRWENGLAQFKSINQEIIDLLNTKEDHFLDQVLDDKNYSFRFLLNGMIDHHIYHAGQIAYVKKLLES